MVSHLLQYVRDMSFADWPRRWLRQEQTEFTRLSLAFAISLAVHLVLAGTYYTGKEFGWWQRLQSSPLVKSARMLTQMLMKKEPTQPLPAHDTPLLFVDVSPAQATPEPPKDAQYYSSRNSVAANPDPTEDTGVPKITGKQEQVPKTEDVPRETFQPLQPAAPPKPEQPAPQKPEPPQPAEKPRLAQVPGDLALGTPSPEPSPDAAQGKKKSRPLTIKDALARKTGSQIPGEKMKQEGGVRHRLELASLDAKATPFGAYDAMLVEAISQRWYMLLDDRDYASDSRGRVVIQFYLHQDGRITGLRVADNSAGDVLGLICQKAVRDPSPYPEWPQEMRRLAGDRRSIQFTFYYN